jgi:hypothetical protein
MPAKDLHHEIVKEALIKEGWNITHDPFRIKWGKRDFYVDLGAELILAAEKENEEIAVEIKTFGGKSPMNDLENALGQYVLYLKLMEETNPTRVLYLAASSDAFSDVFDDPVGKLMIQKLNLRILIFDINTRTITQWIK